MKTSAAPHSCAQRHHVSWVALLAAGVTVSVLGLGRSALAHDENTWPSDLAFFSTCFGPTVPPGCEAADLDQDGLVSSADFSIWKAILSQIAAFDLNLDSAVDTRVASDNADRNVFSACFGSPVVPGDPCAPADFNDNGVVDPSDFTVFKAGLTDALPADLDGDGVANYFANSPPGFTLSREREISSGETLYVYVWAQDTDSPITYTLTDVPAGTEELGVVLGDVDSDGDVTVADVDTVSTAATGPYQSQYDFDGDGTVDQADIDLVSGLVGETRLAIRLWFDLPAGTYTMTLAALDHHGAESSASLTLTVLDVDVFASYSTYDDVLVVVNDNSPISLQVGNYFANARGIDVAHVVHLAAPTQETIDRATFEAEVRLPIEAFLVSNGLVQDINYIVTTKGVPLRIQGDGNERASVDSELTQILGPHANLIGAIGSTSNPFANVEHPFSRRTWGIYLVTRLTGYQFADIQALVDHAGAAMGSPGRFVFDVDPGRDTGGYIAGNDWLRAAAEITGAAGFVTVLDETILFLTGQSDVLGYASWGSNDAHDTNNAIPGFTWVPGALAETFVSTSARTFTAPPTYGQSLIADLIAEGVTGAKGYVYEPFLAAMAHPDILFDRYTRGYNLADSYYMASQQIGWMDVVVGDPKTRIVPAVGPAFSVPALSGYGLALLACALICSSRVRRPPPRPCIFGSSHIFPRSRMS